MTPPAPARLVGYFARSAPRCVIIRRGPSRYSQMILWHTDSDLFEPGQWIRGNVKDLTLTSSGGHAALSVMGARSRIRSWEDTELHVVCRPPYFTALEVVIGSHCYCHSEFKGDDRLCIGGPERRSQHIVNAVSPCPFKRWSPDAVLLPPYRHVIDASRGPAKGCDQRGREILFAGGKVFAMTAEGKPKELFDANRYTFEQIEAPDWAKDW